MMEPAVSPPATIDLEDLGLDRGAHLLIERALSGLPVGSRLEVRGRDPALGVHLRGFARARVHPFEALPSPSEDGGGSFPLTRGSADRDRWLGAERPGGSAPAGILA